MTKGKNKERKNKREKFVGKQGKREFEIKPIYLVGVVLVALIAFVVFGSSGPEKAEEIPTGTQTAGTQSTKDPNSLYIPLSKINDGKAHFYEHQSVTGKTIRLFVLKSSDGVYRAAFDACDVCYREKKGYRQEGDNMICNNCGRKFPSNRINVEQGGCNPAPLLRNVEGDYLVIKKSDIEGGVRYF